jgi:hypothetical protein
MKVISVAVSKLRVLEAIPDKITLDIFNGIDKNPETSDSLTQKLTLTCKVSYKRSANLLKSNIIKRKGEKFTLYIFWEINTLSPVENSQCGGSLKAIESDRSLSIK